MKTELFGGKLQNVLKEMKDISHTNFYLFSKEGAFLAGTQNMEDREAVEEAVLVFRDSIADSQIAYGYHFQKLLIRGQIEYILLSDMSSSGEYSFVIAQMAASQIKNLHLMIYTPMDEQQYLKQLIMGSIDEEQFRRTVHRRKPDEYPRMLYVLEFDSEKTEIALETLKNLFMQDAQDYLIDMDDNQLVLIKNISGWKEDEYHEVAHMMIDNIQSEAMINVRVGYGKSVNQLSQLAKSYKDACMALKVCKIFQPKESVAVYGQLGIGQLIYQLPMDLCQQFLHEVFVENQQELLDEEMLATVDKLFENNLNISETARQLYIHRNTLVYRLERMQKILGLDIRLFEDAMMFRIAMMVQSHVNFMKSEKGNIVK